jgi:hypothetical protein
MELPLEVTLRLGFPLEVELQTGGLPMELPLEVTLRVGFPLEVELQTGGLHVFNFPRK